jgi:hypothetical protein
MGRFTAPRTSLARGYIDDGTPSGRRFVFELPGDGWPPRTVDLPDPPGGATPGRMRRYRSVGRRRGYVYLYVFEEMPGVFPWTAPPADGAAEPGRAVLPDVDVPDGQEPDAPGTHSHPIRNPTHCPACTLVASDRQQAARRRRAVRERERTRMLAASERDGDERARRAAERGAARRAAAQQAAARRAAARATLARRATAQRAAAGRAAAAYAETRRAVDGERAAITRAAATQRELSEVKMENLALRAVLRPQAQQVVVAQQAARHVAAQQAQIAARAY